MTTKITIVAKNDTPMSVLGDNPNKKVKAVWEVMLNLIALQSGDTVNVENVEVWDNELQTDIHDFTDCDFCKDRNCKDCEGGKDELQTERKGEL